MRHGFKFSGATCVVTGGASGVGAAFCQDLVGRGARVGVADIEFDRAQETALALSADGAAAKAFHVDVVDADSVERLAVDAWDAFGRVDGVFNNAGVGAGRDLLNTKERDFDWIWGVNVKGVWHGCRSFGRRFVDQDGPALICNTGSEHSLGVPHLNNSAYTATKHAVHGFTDVLRHELPERIQVSLFCPGLTATDIWNSTRNRPDNFGGARDGGDVAKQLIGEGMAASDVASRALDALETGAFYIVTHPHNQAMVEARSRELTAAFEAQTAGVDGDGFDVNDVLARILGQRG